jgi:hypothetical protein
MVAAPKTFFSYSHDSNDHKAWVLRLATDLVNCGVDVTLDQWDLGAGQDIVAFMERSISESEHVILICSEAYVRKAEARAGGVGFESMVVTGEVAANLDTRKFIPLVRGNITEPRIPRFLGARLYIDFSNDSSYLAKRNDLLRVLHRMPANVKPTLGVSPFAGQLLKQPDSDGNAHEADLVRTEAPLVSEQRKTIALFRLKTKWLEGRIAAQEAALAHLNKGTQKWKNADAELQRLKTDRLRTNSAVLRLTAAQQGGNTPESPGG